MARRVLLALLLVAATAHAASPVREAVARFEAGDYGIVVSLLRPLVDAGRFNDPVENAQALRLYGIACVLTGQRLAAESAFLHLLELEPRARLDPMLVRPEVVDFFNDVRARHRQELLDEVEHRRPRTALLNLFPPVGQFQNGQKTKFAVLLGAELSLLAVNLATGIWLHENQRDDATFDDNSQATSIKAVNALSFGVLAAVLIYGMIDGFYYFGRLNNELERDQDSLRTATAPKMRLLPSSSGLAVAF